MITLYREVTTVSTVRIYGYSGMPKDQYAEIPVKHTSSVPVKMPDTIFTYEGWTMDYVHKKLYRWKDTDREQIFYMDASLIDESNNIVSPDDWLATKGNKIICYYYDSCPYCPPETQAEGNPSGHLDNVWLMSYQKQDNTEVYLYEFTYDMRDNIVIQRSIEPRIHVNMAPGTGNVLGEVADIEAVPEDNNGGTADDNNETPGYNDTGDDENTQTTDNTTFNDENYEP